MAKDEKFFVADKLEDMIFLSYKKANCGSCGDIVGISESSRSIFEKHKDMKIICSQCFQEKDDADIEIQRPTPEQLKEIRKKLPDFGEKEIRETIKKIKRKSSNPNP